MAMKGCNKLYFELYVSDESARKQTTGKRRVGGKGAWRRRCRGWRVWLVGGAPSSRIHLKVEDLWEGGKHFFMTNLLITNLVSFRQEIVA